MLLIGSLGQAEGLSKVGRACKEVMHHLDKANSLPCSEKASSV